MFCTKCGQQIPDDAQFCSNCQNKITTTPSNKTNAALSTENKHKKIVVGLSIAVSIVLVVCAIFFVLSNVVPKRVDFDLKFNQNEIQKFMKTVCANAEVEDIQVEQIALGGDTFTYGDFMSANVIIKPHGMKEEEIEIRFYNSDDTDNVANIVIYYYDHDSENEMMCRDAIIEALEISFCGTSKAKEYTSGFNSMGTKPATYDTKLVTDYPLSDDANVRITWREWSGSPMFEWTGTYCIYKK